MAENNSLDGINLTPIDIESECKPVVNNEDEPLKPQSMRDIRSLIFHFLYAMDSFDYTVALKDIVDNFINGFDLEITYDFIAVKMAEQIIENRGNLDEQIKPFLKNWKLERLSCCTKLILRFAFWELEQENAVSSIIINEAVELAKCFGEKDAYKFINGILDEACKKRNIPKG